MNTETKPESTDAVEAPVTAAAPETVEVPVLNEESGRWEMKPVDQAKGRVIVAGMMTEGWERDERDRMDTSGYDKRMHRCWINMEKSDPATVHAAELGYRPVLDRRAARDHGHQVGKLPGWEGEVVHSGDAVLVECPVAMVEAREARRGAIREAQKRDSMEAGRNHLDTILSDATHGDPSSGVIDNFRGRQVTGYEKNAQALTPEMLTSDGSNRAMLGAQALVAAQERMTQADRGRISFGGFRSAEGKDGAIPESPYFRSIVDRQLGK